MKNIKTFIEYMKNSHKFFVAESKQFMVLDTYYYLYYPLAYIKFMSASILDAIKYIKQK